MASPSSGGTPATQVLNAILQEISVPMPVLKEARARRNRVLEVAAGLSVVRGRYSSGSVAYGTANSPLEDADGGVRINRRLADMREFGPDDPHGLGPGPLMEFVAEYVLDRLHAGDYPDATVDATGKRAVKFEFHTPVDIDDLDGPIDPYVDFIIGLARVEARGLWIPNRSVPACWDVADPEHHLDVMNHRGTQALRSRRAHVIRLTKRAIKRDHDPIMCSWNVSALAIIYITEVQGTLPEALAGFLTDAARDIASRLTPDPSPVVEDIDLPRGITQATAARRLAQMASYAQAAVDATDVAGARRAYSYLYGVEIDAIRAREARVIDRRVATGASLAAIPSIYDKTTNRSHGE
jgi:hypothetical protein